MATPASITAAYRAARSVSGVAVQYYRGQAAAVELTAIPGRTEYEIEGTNVGVIISTQSRDYIFLAAEFGSPPSRGDRITEVIDGQTRTFEVMGPGGERHYRYGDQWHTLIRVHTKRVS